MNSFFETAWKLLPKSFQDAAAMAVDRIQGNPKPDSFPIPDLSKKYRVFITPVNYSGQGYQWARQLEQTGLVSAVNLVHIENNPLKYPADYSVRWRISEHSKYWQNELLNYLKKYFTHVIVEACYPPLGGLYKGNVAKQINVLRAYGIKVAIVGHGTDVRLPSRHAQLEKGSYFKDDEWVNPELVEPVVFQNLQLIEQISVPTFVTTAGLLLDLPEAHFLGVIIEPERWVNAAALLEKPKIKVVHAPTNPVTKGSTYIRPIINKLVDEGIIEYFEIQGIPNDQMVKIYSDADVVLDQFRSGDYGVAACETMAAGRLVLTHVSDQVRDLVENQAQMQLPIPETTIDTLEFRLRDIAADRLKYVYLASLGPEFVKRLHSGEYSRRVLQKYFIEDS